MESFPLDALVSVLGQLKRTSRVKRARLVCRRWREAGNRVLVARGVVLKLPLWPLAQMQSMSWVRKVDIFGCIALYPLVEGWSLRRLSFTCSQIGNADVRLSHPRSIETLHIRMPVPNLDNCTAFTMLNLEPKKLVIHDPWVHAYGSAGIDVQEGSWFSASQSMSAPNEELLLKRRRAVGEIIALHKLQALEMPYYLTAEHGLPQYTSLHRLSCAGFAPAVLPYLLGLRDLQLVQIDWPAEMTWFTQLSALQRFSWVGESFPRHILLEHPTLREFSLRTITFTTWCKLVVRCPELLSLRLTVNGRARLETPKLRNYRSKNARLPKAFPPTLQYLQLKELRSPSPDDRLALVLHGTAIRECEFFSVVLTEFRSPPLQRLRLHSCRIDGYLPPAETIRVSSYCGLHPDNARQLQCHTLHIHDVCPWPSIDRLPTNHVKRLSHYTHGCEFTQNPVTYPPGLLYLRTNQVPANLEALCRAGLRELVLWNREYVPPPISAGTTSGGLQVSFYDSA